MDENIVRMLSLLSALIKVVPTFYALKRVSNGDREQRILSLLIFISLFFEIAAYILGSILHTNNLFLLHLFTTIELVFFVWLFYRETIVFIPKVVIQIFVGGFVVYALYYATLNDNITSFNTYPRAVEGITVISMVILYFYSLLKSLKIVVLQRVALFWISVGGLIYFSGGLFIFIFSNVILISDSMSFTIWAIHACLSITLYIFYTIALWIKPNTEV